MSTTEKSKKRSLEKIAPEQDPVRSQVSKRGRVGGPAQGHATEPAAARLTASNRARDERAERRSRLTQQSPRASSRSRAAHRARSRPPRSSCSPRRSARLCAKSAARAVPAENSTPSSESSKQFSTVSILPSNVESTERTAPSTAETESTEPNGAAKTSSQEQVTDSVEQGCIKVVKEALGVAKEAYTLVVPAGKDLELACEHKRPQILEFLHALPRSYMLLLQVDVRLTKEGILSSVSMPHPAFAGIVPDGECASSLVADRSDDHHDGVTVAPCTLFQAILWLETR